MVHHEQNRKDDQQREEWIQAKIADYKQRELGKTPAVLEVTNTLVRLFTGLELPITHNLEYYLYQRAALQYHHEFVVPRQPPSAPYAPEYKPNDHLQSNESSAPQLWEQEPPFFKLIREKGSGCISLLNQELCNNSIMLTARGIHNQTCLHIATLLHEDLHVSELIEFLLNKQPELINMQDDSGNTAAHLSLMMKKYLNTRVCQTLLNCKEIDIDLQNGAKQTLLHLAITDAPASKMQEATELATLLINKGANLELSNLQGQTPLHLAIQHGRAELTKLLLNKQASVNAADQEGNRAIHYATCYAQPEIMELLKKRSADFTATNHAGQNALHYAIMIWNANWKEKKTSKFAFWAAHEQENSAERTVTKLLEYNNHALSTGDQAGWTPLHYACVTEEVGQNKSYMIELLKKKANYFLAKKADNLLTATTHEGNPAFMIAILFGMPIVLPQKEHLDKKIALAKLLLPDAQEQKLEHIQIINAAGNTALHFAVMIRSPYQSQTIDYLLAKGANPFKKNKNNASPYDLLHTIREKIHDQTEEERACLKSIAIKFEQHPEYNPNIVALSVEALPQFTLPAALLRSQNKLPWYVLSSQELSQKTPTQANYPPIPTIKVQEIDGQRPAQEIDTAQDLRYPWRRGQNSAAASTDSFGSSSSAWSEVNANEEEMANSTGSLVYIEPGASRSSRTTIGNFFELPANTPSSNLPAAKNR